MSNTPEPSDRAEGAQDERSLTTLPVEPEGATALERIINRVALDPDFSVDKLDHLLAVQERWQQSEARRAYTAALAAFKSEAPSITKGQTASFRTRAGGQMSYSYASLDTVTEAVIPALSKHGLSHHWTMAQSVRETVDYVTVTCTLTHRDGHSESVTLGGPRDDSGQKNPLQMLGSATSYLQRYTLLAITGLAARGADDDGHSTDERTARKPGPSEYETEQRDRQKRRQQDANVAAWVEPFGVAVGESEVLKREDVRAYARAVDEKHVAGPEALRSFLGGELSKIVQASNATNQVTAVPRFVEAIEAWAKAEGDPEDPPSTITYAGEIIDTETGESLDIPEDAADEPEHDPECPGRDECEDPDGHPF